MRHFYRNSQNATKGWPSRVTFSLAAMHAVVVVLWKFYANPTYFPLNMSCCWRASCHFSRNARRNGDASSLRIVANTQVLINAVSRPQLQGSSGRRPRKGWGRGVMRTA
jgi:hypothetical protein